MSNLLTLSRKDRRKITGEDFTPIELVNEILDRCDPQFWNDPSKTWLDPTAGDGNFLVEIKKRLELAGHSSDHILNDMIFGCELMLDNCLTMVSRLYGVKPDSVKVLSTSNDHYGRYQFKNEDAGISLFTVDGIFVPNIVCADGLKYNYNFGRLSDEDVQKLNMMNDQMWEKGFKFPQRQPKVRKRKHVI